MEIREIGRFIVFEGIDGCGKGTQLKLVHNYLWDLSKENEIYSTREPTRHSKEIREKMQQGKDVENDKEWYAEHFIKDRENHSKNFIVPSQLNGIYILCDRYKYSTLAYQQTQGINLDKLIEMHSRYSIAEPDLTLIYDCQAEIAYERRLKENESAREVFDRDLEFQKKLRQNYLNLKKILSEENIVIINGNQEVEDVFKETKKHIDKLFSKKSVEI